MGPEEVRWPAFVLVSPVTHDPGEAGAGARGQHERANNAGFKPDTSDIRLAIAREHPELRVEACTMAARPAAEGWSADSDTEHLAGRRERTCQHYPLAASR